MPLYILQTDFWSSNAGVMLAALNITFRGQGKDITTISKTDEQNIIFARFITLSDSPGNGIKEMFFTNIS